MKKFLFTTLLSTVFFILSSVAQTGSPAKFDGKATVYFYSLATTTTIGRVKKPIFLDDVEIADIRPERYFIVMVEPGKHVFRLRNKKFGGVEMDFEAGKTYYLKIGWESEGVLKPSGVFVIPAESGAYDVKQLRPVGPENIKRKDIVFTEPGKS